MGAHFSPKPHFYFLNSIYLCHEPFACNLNEPRIHIVYIERNNYNLYNFTLDKENLDTTLISTNQNRLFYAKWGHATVSFGLKITSLWWSFWCAIIDKFRFLSNLSSSYWFYHLLNLSFKDNTAHNHQIFWYRTTEPTRYCVWFWIEIDHISWELACILRCQHFHF